jgi:glutaredoxin 3
LAHALGRALDGAGPRVIPNLLVRHRAMSSQAGLSAAARARNVAGAFGVHRRYGRNAAGAHIVLVDDVYTTGSTLGACARRRSVVDIGVRIADMATGQAGNAYLNIWVPATAMAGATDENRAVMAEVDIYTGMMCDFCLAAKRLLKQKGVDFNEIDVTFSRSKRGEMMHRARGSHTVPQIFIDGEHVGGCDELYMLEQAGELDAKLGLA